MITKVEDTNVIENTNMEEEKTETPAEETAETPAETPIDTPSEEG
ncbi:MAG: hypothetical protein NUV80_00905 [Candidatus Berkelbacteria bacterium]|nr:hypothetical protein [Candidatus Berkelbacteria bacterium]